MPLSHRRHDISDRVWSLLEPHLPGRAGSWGGKARNNREFINAVFWILRTGAPWRDLPADYGGWKNTSGTTADCRQAQPLIQDIDAEYLLADRGYDTDALITQTESQGMKVVIPAKKNRKNKRNHDKALYKLRHLVENAFLHLKRWRGIATRYAKNSASFLAAIQIRCIALWANLS